MTMLHLYNSEPSGNCYKIRLILAHLGIPYETTEVDVFRGGTRPEGLSKQNALNRVPMLVLDDGRCLPESTTFPRTRTRFRRCCAGCSSSRTSTSRPSP